MKVEATANASAKKKKKKPIKSSNLIDCLSQFKEIELALLNIKLYLSFMSSIREFLSSFCPVTSLSIKSVPSKNHIICLDIAFD